MSCCIPPSKLDCAIPAIGHSTTVVQEDVHNLFVATVLLFYAPDALGVFCFFNWGFEFS